MIRDTSQTVKPDHDTITKASGPIVLDAYTTLERLYYAVLHSATPNHAVVSITAGGEGCGQGRLVTVYPRRLHVSAKSTYVGQRHVAGNLTNPSMGPSQNTVVSPTAHWAWRGLLQEEWARAKDDDAAR